MAARVVQLCTMTAGGAGRAAYRLHHALRLSGVDSTFFTLSSKFTDSSVKVINYDGSLTSAPANNLYLDYYLAYLGHLLKSFVSRPKGLEIFTDVHSEISLSKLDEIHAADIVHLHWVAGMLDYVDAANVFKNKKIVWTLHDMNPFTGGCHYAGSCTRYREQCGRCPQLGSAVERDLSRDIWNAKRAFISKLNLTVVAPSRWLATCAMQSSLFKNVPVVCIPNGVPTDVYAPYDAIQAKKEFFNIEPQVKLIVFIADSLENHRKGFIYLVKALQRYSPPQELCLVAIGSLDTTCTHDVKHRVVMTGHLEDENILRFLYTMADVLVIPSIEDNLPNTVLEAMACGTPVVGYDIGGIPDMVEHGVTGCLAKPASIDSLCEGIDYILFHPEHEGMRRKCRARAESRYSLQVHASRFISLYQTRF